MLHIKSKEKHGKQYSDDEELIRCVRKIELSIIFTYKRLNYKSFSFDKRRILLLSVFLFFRKSIWDNNIAKISKYFLLFAKFIKIFISIASIILRISNDNINKIKFQTQSRIRTRFAHLHTGTERDV